MSMINKYRVHEVAKDFNTTSKVITQILTDYATTPKNHMQVLENNELDVIFEYLTQHNQAASLADIFASAPKAGEAKPAEKKQEKAAPQQSAGKPAAWRAAASKSGVSPAGLRGCFVPALSRCSHSPLAGVCIAPAPRISHGRHRHCLCSYSGHTVPAYRPPRRSDCSARRFCLC